MPSDAAGQNTQALSLADFTAPSLIVPQLRGRETAEIIQELSQVLKAGGCIPDVLPFYQAALNREFLVGTALEKGMSFPHARVNGLDRVWFALGRSQEPIPWGPRSGPDVRLVFLMAVPATDASNYLLLLSGIARLARDPNQALCLLEPASAPEIYQALRQIPLRARSLAARSTLAA